MGDTDERLRVKPIGAPEGEGSVISVKHGPSAGLTLRAAQDCRLDLVALGEVMLRFDPGEGRIVGARSFNVWEGGGEYNVARGLRRAFGLRSGIVTALVDNPVGRLVEDLMLQGGVDLSHVLWQPFDGVGREARNGIYFLERGFGLRGGMGMMDRGNTAVSQLRAGQVDWDAIFSAGVRWFHTGGVMAALSEGSTELVRAGMEAARRHGVVVSFDCNYRPSLWKTRGGREGSVGVNRSLMPLVDVLFGHEGDVAATVGPVSLGPAWHTLDSYGPMAERVVKEFPTVKVIASTMRQATTANRNCWGGFCWAEGTVYSGLKFDDMEILDRVGGGDSFASGLIYGLMQGKGMQWALDCGVVHGALAMTTPGDGSVATLAEVERLMGGGTAGVQR
jgi:2-dehydro-3-deoxygluconokinase